MPRIPGSPTVRVTANLKKLGLSRVDCGSQHQASPVRRVPYMSVVAIRLDSSPAAHFVPSTPKLWALLVEARFDPPTGFGECIEFYRPGAEHHGEFTATGRFIPSRPTVRVVRTDDHLS